MPVTSWILAHKPEDVIDIGVVWLSESNRLVTTCVESDKTVLRYTGPRPGSD